MPNLVVTIELPYYLRLRSGEYPTKLAGGIISILQPQTVMGIGAKTSVRTQFTHPATADPDEKQRHRVNDAEQSLRRTNRLLRWYRVASQKPEIIELTRAQASPFRCRVVDAADSEGWNEPIDFEASGPTDAALSIDELTTAVQQGLSGGEEPLVADLFPIDAERALHDGRFRETVLLCWSMIDAVFNRKYDSLVKDKLEGEWRAALEFFTGADFGLRNKMSAVMHLVANRSLFREPDRLWDDLSTSYDKRNAIIHRGDNATEDEARTALKLARRIIEIMDSL